MTLEDLQKMSDEQIEILVHEKIMGQCAHVLTYDPESQNYRCQKCHYLNPRPGFDYLKDFEGRIVVPKSYCTDRNAAGEVLEKIGADRKAQLRLTDFLATRLLNEPERDDWYLEYKLLTASPRLLMLAALMAIGEER